MLVSKDEIMLLSKDEIIKQSSVERNSMIMINILTTSIKLVLSLFD